MPELSWAPRRRTESYSELVAVTAGILSRNLPVDEFIAAVKALIAEFFDAETAVVIVCGGDEDARQAEATLSALRERVFAQRTLRVLRGDAALRSARGQSLHAPIRFGEKLLGGVAVMCAHPTDGYSVSDLALLEGWATLIAVHINGLQIAAQNVALERLVGTDGLTGLRNRRGLDAELDLIWRAARRTGESVAIVMVDVDFFKVYNDTYGHLAGDRCLAQISASLAAGLRPGDIAARFGGEEFVALLRDADRDRAVKIAERLRESVADLQIPHSGSTLGYVTASFGVATAMPRNGGESTEALAAADAILYVAKGTGRNRVAAEGYASTSALAQAHHSSDHNLPTLASSFCGRLDDISAVIDALERSRLVTLVAFGGVGKTRLSIEVASRRYGSFRDGAWFIDLAGSADPELLPERVAAAIGLPDIPGSRTIAGVAELLAQRELLIVLDNCEHVVAACGQFCAAVLAVAPAVRILATSRERLDLPAETVISLAPLALPPAESALTTGDLRRYPALKLFVDRATAIAPISLMAANLETIAHICRRLDGIALAIELAAARVRMLSLDELRLRLDAQFAVVGRAGGPGSTRQRTLRGLIDWSYDLLDERERHVFSRLGIFAGPFSLDFANGVCGDADADVLDTLEELVDKSLVVLDASVTGKPVFRLFESIREYARDRLIEEGALEQLQRRLIDRISAHGVDVDAASSTPNWRISMQPLEHSVDDVRACLEATIVLGRDATVGALLAANLAAYWQDRGRGHEGRTWLERALTLPGLAPRVRAKLLNNFIWFQPLFGNAARREEIATEALGLATGARDEKQISAALAFIGDAAFNLGEFERARTFGLRALERYVAAGDMYGEAHASNLIGAATDLIDGAGTLEPTADYTWYYRCIELCRQLNRSGFAARAMGNIAEAEFFKGHIEAGIAIAKDALAALEAENDHGPAGWMLCNLGLYHQYSDEYDIAKAMLVDGLRLLLEMRDDYLIGGCCDNLAGIALHYGRFDRAAQFLGRADALYAEIALERQPLFARLADAWRDRARQSLGAERFACESAIGSRFTRAQIVDEARALSP